MRDFSYDIEFKYNNKQYIYNTLTSGLVELDLEGYQKYIAIKKMLTMIV